jgi:hypothetical protein
MLIVPTRPSFVTTDIIIYGDLLRSLLTKVIFLLTSSLYLRRGFFMQLWKNIIRRPT